MILSAKALIMLRLTLIWYCSRRRIEWLFTLLLAVILVRLYFIGLVYLWKYFFIYIWFSGGLIGLFYLFRVCYCINIYIVLLMLCKWILHIWWARNLNFIKVIIRKLILIFRIFNRILFILKELCAKVSNFKAFWFD